MTTLREAAEMALEALEEIHVGNMTPMAEESWNKAITALRAALAEPPTNQCGETCERAKLCAVCARGLADGDKASPTGKDCLQVEPVAWMVYTLDGKSAFVTDNPKDFKQNHRALPLYTHPPKRKPLTDEDLDKLAMDEDGLPNSHLEFARAIERAHGIGGEE